MKPCHVIKSVAVDNEKMKYDRMFFYSVIEKKYFCIACFDCCDYDYKFEYKLLSIHISEVEGEDQFTPLHFGGINECFLNEFDFNKALNKFGYQNDIQRKIENF